MVQQYLPAKIAGTAQEFGKYLFSDEMKKKFEMAVPKWLSVDRLLRVVFSSVLKNPKLLQCTTESLMSAIMQCAQLGLEPILGRAHLIPYRNNNKPGKPLECQFQPGYQGLVDLAERSGKVETVKAHVVYENDEFDIKYGLHEDLIHNPKMDGDRGNPIGAYTVWTRKSGVKTYSFMLLDDIYRDFRSKSVAYNYAVRDKRTDTPWIENEPEMLKKSLVKRHSKLEPASVDYMQAVEADNMVEIGAPQVGILEQFDFPTRIPPETESEDEGPAQHLLDKFDVKVSEKEDVNLEKLSEYLALCAKTQDGATVNHVKASAMRKGFDKFWGFYGDWLKSQKPESKKEDAIRKLYKGLGDRAFEEFVDSHATIIPGMDQVYQDEIRASHYKRAKKKGGLLEGKPYPLDEPKEEVPVEEVEQVEETERSDFPISLNCPRTYDETPEKNAEGKVLTIVCETKCKFRENNEGEIICDVYGKYQDNINS